MNHSAFLTFCYLCSPDHCEIEEFSLSWMMDWELGYGGWLPCSHPHVPAAPFAPHCHLCSICVRATELFLWLLVWNESGQGQTCCGAGKGEEWESGSQQLAGIAMEPHTNPSDFSKVTRDSVSKKLKPLLCYTGCWPQAVAGRKWLYIYSAWIYCLFANTDVWINSCFLVYAKIQTYWTGHNCRSSGVSWVRSVGNS